MQARIIPFDSISEIDFYADEPIPTFQEATRMFQRKLLEETLLATEWNVSEAARRLDLARSHVYNLIHSFGLSRHEAFPASQAAEPQESREAPSLTSTRSEATG